MVPHEMSTPPGGIATIGNPQVVVSLLSVVNELHAAFSGAEE